MASSIRSLRIIVGVSADTGLKFVELCSRKGNDLVVAVNQGTHGALLSLAGEVKHWMLMPRGQDVFDRKTEDCHGVVPSPDRH
jgi:hypothetical protein